MLKTLLIFCLLAEAFTLPAIAAGGGGDRLRRSASASKASSHKYRFRKRRLRRVSRPAATLPSNQAQAAVLPTQASVPAVATPTPIATVQVSDLDRSPERTEISRTENFGDDVQGGNVEVKVTSNGSATVKLGMAERGVVVIEFPASDPVYKIFAGDENFVRVDCGARDKDDRCQNLPGDSLVLYPGNKFNQWESTEDAATAVTVQRASGIVVSFIIVPVRSMANHAFHVAVRYDLADVVAERRAAGLPYNLTNTLKVQRDMPVIEPRDGGGMPNIASGAPVNAGVGSDQAQYQNAVLSNTQADAPGVSETDLQTTLENRTVAQLKNAGKSNARLYFNKPFHGLSLAVVQSDTRVTDYSIDVVAVKNITLKPIRLVPDQPEIFIESGAKDGASVANERLSLIYVATTADADDVLLPNQTYYFAFAYKTPILGAKQRLSVGFAQREASDEPTTLALLGLLR